ncbi:MAG: transcriptional regulator NarL [Methanobacterium sp. PtaU1.Bin097]|jgi:DNA-binding response OmpR family regulator|nr:MAG: transcriptional regulator NarL [Methanobacterium sp. PtaU1.Bin097]
MRKVEPIKILMVEDNPGDARLIIEMLKETDELDFDVSHVVRLDEGLKYLVTKEFDVIFLDLCLPDSKGIETFNVMNYNAMDTPIIVLSGLEDEIFAESAVGKGADEYLVKGEIDSHILVESVKHTLEIG